jgi:hypothetical protein
MGCAPSATSARRIRMATGCAKQVRSLSVNALRILALSPLALALRLCPLCSRSSCACLYYCPSPTVLTSAQRAVATSTSRIARAAIVAVRFGRNLKVASLVFLCPLASSLTSRAISPPLHVLPHLAVNAGQLQPYARAPMADPVQTYGAAGIQMNNPSGYDTASVAIALCWWE